MTSQIKIGGIHRINIPEDALDDPIFWVNQRSKKFFSTLKEIDGKKAVIRTRSRTDGNKYIATLVDLPQDTFYILKKYLVIEEPPEEIPCSCALNILVNRGCQCGAFSKEKKS